jgi:hypothetical protein
VVVVVVEVEVGAAVGAVGTEVCATGVCVDVDAVVNGEATGVEVDATAGVGVDGSGGKVVGATGGVAVVVGVLVGPGIQSAINDSKALAVVATASTSTLG